MSGEATGLETWGNFYLVTSAAAATLVGLLFVVLTLAADRLAASESKRIRTYLTPSVFQLAFVLLLLLWMLSFLADLGAAGGTLGSANNLSSFLRYLSSSDHFEQLVKGLIDTTDLAYFAVLIGCFLLLAKAAVESVRWR